MSIGEKFGGEIIGGEMSGQHFLVHSGDSQIYKSCKEFIIVKIQTLDLEQELFYVI